MTTNADYRCWILILATEDCLCCLLGLTAAAECLCLLYMKIAVSDCLCWCWLFRRYPNMGLVIAEITHRSPITVLRFCLISVSRECWCWHLMFIAGADCLCWMLYWYLLMLMLTHDADYTYWLLILTPNADRLCWLLLKLILTSNASDDADYWCWIVMLTLSTIVDYLCLQLILTIWQFENFTIWQLSIWQFDKLTNW